MMRAKKTIKSELAAAVAETEPDLDRISALTEELSRVRRMRPAKRERAVRRVSGRIDPGQDRDQATPRTNRIIYQPMISESDEWGSKNDARRGSPWR